MGTKEWNEFEREVKQEHSVSTIKMNQNEAKTTLTVKQDHLQNSSSNKTQECYLQQSTWRTLQGPLVISLCNNIRSCPDLMTRSIFLTVEKQDQSPRNIYIFIYFILTWFHYMSISQVDAVKKKKNKLILQQTGDFI